MVLAIETICGNGFLYYVVQDLGRYRSDLGEEPGWSPALRFGKRPPKKAPCVMSLPASPELFREQDCVSNSDGDLRRRCSLGNGIDFVHGRRGRLCRIFFGPFWGTTTLGDESAKRAAREDLAAQLSAAGPIHEE